jgi:NAD(P)H dehydrogenase (quinone)
MKILVVYYSMYGHVFKLAQAVVEGAQSVPGAEVVMRRVEDLPFNQNKLKQSKHAQMTLEMQKDIPFCTLEELRTADGILFGTPTRYGNMTSQMKALFDQTGEL